MTHRFPIKEVALQAGMSTATVDRVINNRAHVSPQTRARVMAALDELEAQEGQMAARGRRMFIDVVVEAPARFSREIRRALEDELAALRPAVMRPRFLFREKVEEAEMVRTLARIAKRGSHGVILKARNLAGIRVAVEDLAARGIPVVTAFTDIPDAPRQSYVGLDNAAAGRTAAWLIAQRMQAGRVLMSVSNERFHGEVERSAAFRAGMAARCPNVTLVSVEGGAGLNAPTAEAVTAAVQGKDGPWGVYSMGGGNAAILLALDRAKVQAQVFVAHDLDQDNRALLAEERIDWVLHHDLRQDMRRAGQSLISFHGLMPEPDQGRSAAVQVVTPENLPPV